MSSLRELRTLTRVDFQPACEHSWPTTRKSGLRNALPRSWIGSGTATMSRNSSFGSRFNKLLFLRNCSSCRSRMSGIRSLRTRTAQCAPFSATGLPVAVPRRGTANSLQGYQAVRDRTTDCGKEASSSTAQTQSRTVSLNRNSPVRFQAIGSIAQLHFTTPGVVEKNDQVIESVRAA